MIGVSYESKSTIDRIKEGNGVMTSENFDEWLEEHDRQIKVATINEYKYKVTEDIRARAKSYEMISEKHDAEIFNCATDTCVSSLKYFARTIKYFSTR